MSYVFLGFFLIFSFGIILDSCNRFILSAVKSSLLNCFTFSIISDSCNQVVISAAKSSLLTYVVFFFPFSRLSVALIRVFLYFFLGTYGLRVSRFNRPHLPHTRTWGDCGEMDGNWAKNKSGSSSLKRRKWDINYSSGGIQRVKDIWKQLKRVKGLG
jgi:hypothetical protein